MTQLFGAIMALSMEAWRMRSAILRGVLSARDRLDQVVVPTGAAPLSSTRRTMSPAACRWVSVVS